MSCTFYSFRQGDYYCNKNNKYVNSNDYYRYCRNYSYDECPIYKNNNSSSGCYLTTIVCNILKKKDNDLILDTMRNFRNNYLLKNNDSIKLLKEYDLIGPVISEQIRNDNDNNVLATGLYNGALSNICLNILNKNYEKAIENYRIMTLCLINYYGLKHQYNSLNIESYNANLNDLGHARQYSIKKGK